MPAAFATRSGARLRQANRLFALGGVLTRDELMIIAADDIRKSRVFTERKSGLPAEPRPSRPSSFVGQRPTNA
jgi:hypothetical protein